MYAIIKTGGKQYRVEQGQTLLIERLPDDEGATVDMQPLLFVDGETLIDGADLSSVAVRATIVAHERGPKLRIVKFKPKRGYKRRTGHRQNLTRIEITTLGKSGGSKSGGSKPRSRSRAAATPAATPAASTATEVTDGA